MAAFPGRRPTPRPNPACPVDGTRLRLLLSLSLSLFLSLIMFVCGESVCEEKGVRLASGRAAHPHTNTDIHRHMGGGAYVDVEHVVCVDGFVLCCANEKGLSTGLDKDRESVHALLECPRPPIRRCRSTVRLLLIGAGHGGMGRHGKPGRLLRAGLVTRECRE